MDQQATITSEKPLWRKIVDFPLVAMVIALVIVIGCFTIGLLLARYVVPPVPGLSMNLMLDLVSIPLLIIAYELLIRRLGEHPRDDYRDPKALKLAEAVGYAPHHFQRLFKRDLGLSPAEYARALRNRRTERALKANDRVTDAVYDAGYQSPSGFYSDAKERLGMTPSAWRNGGRGETIRWTTFDSPLGEMLIAATSKGICRLTFDDSEDSLRRLFPNAEVVKDYGGLRELVGGALEAIEQPLAMPDLPIDVAGTAFQEAVWRELRKIPAGETRSYAEIAAAIGHPKAVRAVGSANGDNHVCVLIPCHRVIRSDGSLGGYGGGIERKKMLLASEGHAVADPELPLSE